MGLLIGAVQVLPTIDALRHSVRATADSQFFASGALHPLNLVQLGRCLTCFAPAWSAKTPTQRRLYCGALPLLLCAWLPGMRREWGPWRPLIRAAFLLAAVALLLAFGEHVGLDALQRHLPLVGSFRFPCRAIVLVHLAVACAGRSGNWPALQPDR